MQRAVDMVRSSSSSHGLRALENAAEQIDSLCFLPWEQRYIWVEVEHRRTSNPANKPQ